MKLQSIQLLRGLAVSMVVVHHFMSPYYHFKHTNIVGDFFSHYGMFGVDIFFVISGFIMAYILYNSNIDAKTFLLNRIIRIVPNYWFWTTVVLILTIGGGINTLLLQDATYESVFTSIMFITHPKPGHFPVLSVGWTLNIEMFFYLMITLLLLTQLTIKRLLVFLSILFIILPFIWQTLDLSFYKRVIGNIRLLEFSIGIIIAYLWHKDKKIYFNKAFILCILAILITLYLIDIPKIYKFIILSSLLVYIGLAFENTRILKYKLSKYLIYLGEISFSLYLSHAVTIRSIYYFVGDITTYLEFIFIFTVTITISISLAIISHRYIEIKLSKLLKTKLQSV